MTISASFPGDTDIVANFPSGKRAEGASLLVDHMAAGYHNKVSLEDRAGATPAGTGPDYVTVWQENGVIYAREASGTVGGLEDFLENACILDGTNDFQNDDSRWPINLIAPSGENIGFVWRDDSRDIWGGAEISTAVPPVLKYFINDAAGGSRAAEMEFQSDGDIDVTTGTLKAGGNAVLTSASDLSAQVPSTADAIGTYVFAARTAPSTSLAYGDTIAGSELEPCSMLATDDFDGTSNGSRNGLALSGSTLTGTWRCMGYSRRVDNLDSINRSATLWLRIS